MKDDEALAELEVRANAGDEVSASALRQIRFLREFAWAAEKKVDPVNFPKRRGI